jgi:phosphoribosylaminoimidazole carboxylase PurE protein
MNVKKGESMTQNNLTSAHVQIIMGSDSDREVLLEACKILQDFGIAYDITVSSAHRSPVRTRQLIKQKENEGALIFIVGAGRAAHLAGVIAAETTLPVIGIPIESKPFQGMDSLLSTVQMPGGIPVATMATGKTGAKNAALFSIQILALQNPDLKLKLQQYKTELADVVARKAREIETMSWRPE